MRITEMFTTDWSKLYFKPDDYARPSWLVFADEYARVISEIPNLNCAPLVPEDYMLQVKRFSSDSAGSLDGWLP